MNPTAQTAKPASPLILAHQKDAFERLLAVARARFAIDWKSLPVRPRTNTLIVGPSGSGKTHLANELAKTLDVPLLALSLGQWLPVGASDRSGVQTWPLILKFLLENESAPGAVIFLDEVDKLDGRTSWDQHLRTECYLLLDLKTPPPRDSDDMLAADHAKAARFLQNRALIVGAGAFQHLWDQEPKREAGFGAKPAPASVPSDLSKLAATLPRELVNRFRSQLVVLPQLDEPDYRRMLEQAGALVPAYVQKAFYRIGEARIEEAVRCRQGCRFVEEVLLDAILEERAAVSAPLSPDCERLSLG